MKYCYRGVTSAKALSAGSACGQLLLKRERPAKPFRTTGTPKSSFVLLSFEVGCKLLELFVMPQSALLLELALVFFLYLENVRS